MSCTLCPRGCAVDRAVAKGFCGCTEQMKIARIGLHRYEEPCISGQYGSGAVFFSGCNLRCVFCQNIVLQQGLPGQYFTPEELAESFLALQKLHAHNINLVTPTPHANGILKALLLAKDKGLQIPVVFNTNGYLEAKTVRALKGLVDIWLPDLKYKEQRLADRFSSAPHYFETAFAAIGEMLQQSGQLLLDENGVAKSGMLVRHLVLPNCVFDTRAVLDAIARSFGTETCLSLMRQFTPREGAQPPLNRRLTGREYENAVEYCLSLGFNRVYIQEADSASFAYTPRFSDHITIES